MRVVSVVVHIVIALSMFFGRILLPVKYLIILYHRYNEMSRNFISIPHFFTTLTYNAPLFWRFSTKNHAFEHNIVMTAPFLTRQSETSIIIYAHTALLRVQCPKGVISCHISEDPLLPL